MPQSNRSDGPRVRDVVSKAMRSGPTAAVPHFLAVIQTLYSMYNQHTPYEPSLHLIITNLQWIQGIAVWHALPTLYYVKSSVHDFFHHIHRV